jgi:hypothetical protein
MILIFVSESGTAFNSCFFGTIHGAQKRGHSPAAATLRDLL